MMPFIISIFRPFNTPSAATMDFCRDSLNTRSSNLSNAKRCAKTITTSKISWIGICNLFLSGNLLHQFFIFLFP